VSAAAPVIMGKGRRHVVSRVMVLAC